MMWNGGYGMMGWGGFGWLWPLHVLIPLLILGLIIAAVMAAVRYSADWEDRSVRAGRSSPGLDALDARYARGEINREEYMQKRRDILG
ncbi:MAG TPA: SHOCT domain-containing protein [Bradyrhizobium sp.]|uniref:SHOCT domain-containing protein n=1 Tax=Bradyrhizobium sp. TaxID=376 RepID=UPI002C4EEF44|nr:SHOCT domain-containing protein [Bradyrhizobium sp.]HLZ01158.1 SHOCT domain-containing protein [Bradyrhizobium sp.]